MNPGIDTPNQPSPTPTISALTSHRSRKLAASGIGFALLFALATPTFAGKTGGTTDPTVVTVDGVVEVAGAVDVLKEPVKTPFIQTQNYNFTAVQTYATVSISIPAGKRLVVESITCLARVTSGEAHCWAQLTNVGDVLPHNYAFLTLTNQGVFNNQSYFVGTHKITMRIDPTQMSLDFAVERNAGGAGDFYITVHGYLEDL